MAEKCPVCKNNIKTNDKACSVCGFADLHREFITKEDGELWIKNVVEPYKKQYEESKNQINIFDERGFNCQGVHKNGTRYDSDGYNIEGYDKSGYNKQGFAKNGYNKSGFNAKGVHRNGTRYGVDGYDRDGYDRNGFNIKGIHKNGTRYDANGYNQRGYDKDGYDKNGYTMSMISKHNVTPSKENFQDKKTNIEPYIIWLIVCFLSIFTAWFVAGTLGEEGAPIGILCFIVFIISVLGAVITSNKL